MISSRSGHASVEGLRHIVTNVTRGTEELSICGIDVCLYACLSTSFVNRDWEKNIFSHCHPNIPSFSIITAFKATLSVLEHYGSKKVALFCVYDEEISRMGREAFREKGYDIPILCSLKKTSFTDIARITPLTVYHCIREIELKNIDVICIAGTDIATFPVLRKIEYDTGVPTFSTNLALLWCALRTMKLSYKGIFNNTLFSDMK
jgi:maleate cis-trans isomerase